MVAAYSETSPGCCWQAMFLSLFIGGSRVGGGFLSTSHLCRPLSPTSAAADHIPQNDCHDSDHSQFSTWFSYFSSTFFSDTFSLKLAFSPKFSLFSDKLFLLFWKFLFSLYYVNQALPGVPSFWLGWNTGWTSIVKAKIRRLGPLEAGIRLLQTSAARLSSISFLPQPS